jgi:hypothetical protein
MRELFILAFNTERPYSDQGQRIAAIDIDGGVYMLDIDRNIRAFLPGCPLVSNAILSTYDAGVKEGLPPSINVSEDGITVKEWTERDIARRKFNLLLRDTAEIL